ncbi:MAG: hypothetical protein J6X78_04065 [Treponema sp.]|nr:hypothetical protein [Treponema sp.]
MKKKTKRAAVINTYIAVVFENRNLDGAEGKIQKRLLCCSRNLFIDFNQVEEEWKKKNANQN